MIYDDGTTSRLGENRFFMTTTTAYAAGVMNHLEFCAQALWPELDVQPCLRRPTNGRRWRSPDPKSRTILQAIVDDDISDAAFPFLGSARSLAVRRPSQRPAVPHLVLGRTGLRTRGSGRLRRERRGCADGSGRRATASAPYGVEALSVLRIEKGHRHPQRDQRHRRPARSRLRQDGVADQAGLHRQGDARARRPVRIRRDRALSASCRSIRSHSFRAGSHILSKDAAATLENDQGYLTSVAYSPHLKSQIGLALVIRGPERHGEEVQIWNGLRNEFTRADALRSGLLRFGQ